MLILYVATHPLGITSMVKNHEIPNMTEVNCNLDPNKHTPDYCKDFREIETMDEQQKSPDEKQEQPETGAESTKTGYVLPKKWIQFITPRKFEVFTCAGLVHPSGLESEEVIH
jgi:hypothetical protein